MANPQKSLSGKSFGNLTVIEWAGKAKNGQSLWLCKCSCGNSITASYSNLKDGRQKSCGCMLGNWPRKPRKKILEK